MNSLEIVLEWLLAATLRASALAVVILVCQLLMRRRISAQWRYALWLPMLLVLVLPALPSVPFGLFPRKSSEPSPVYPQELAAADPSAVVKSPEMTVTKSRHAVVNPFFVVWLMGAGGVFAVGWIGYRRSMKRIVKNMVVPEWALIDLLQEASSEAGLAKVPRMIVSSAVDSPAVTGIFRPTLLLPARFPNGFSEEEARLILLHEFTHLKRQDLAVNGLACVLQALHWFNPILWFAFSRMRADRETACDAGVLAISKADRRAAYGGALLKLEGGFSSRGLSLGFVGIFERSAGMKSRIREISAHSPGRRSGWAMGLGMIALLVTFGATKAEESVPQEAVVEDANPPVSGTAYISKKLATIVIPRVDAKDMSLEEMVDFLRAKAKELDTVETDPAKKGINFVIRKKKGEDVVQTGRITMKKQKVLLIDVLKEMADQVDMRFKIDESGVTFLTAAESNAELGEFVKGDGNAWWKTQWETQKGKAAIFAQKLILPRVEFEDVSLSQAVEILNQKARESTKDGPVYAIVIDPSVDPNARIKELRVRNCPLAVVLTYNMDQVKCSLTMDDKEIRIFQP